MAKEQSKTETKKPSRAARRHKAAREKTAQTATAEREHQLQPATRQELFVRRDSGGKIVPVDAVSLFFGRTFKIVPVTYGEVMDKDLSEPVINWPIEDRVALIRNHIIEPDMSGFTLEEAQEGMDPWTFDELASLVVAYSGPLRRAQELKREEEEAAAGKAEGPAPTTT